MWRGCGQSLSSDEMRSGPVMILKIPREDAPQVTLVEDDDVIQAFAADRADEALDIWILPW